MAVAEPEPTQAGAASGLTCPECGGALWEHGSGATTRYVCGVGHAYVPETLAALHERNLDDVLWSSIRALEERADLSSRLADRMRAAGNLRSAERFHDRAEESNRHAESLRNLVLRGTIEDDAEEG